MERRAWTLLLVALAALLLSALNAATAQAPTERTGLRPDAPAYAVRGPHWVGYRAVVIDDGGETPLEADLWYPARNPDGAPEEITYEFTLKSPDLGVDGLAVASGRALRDAPIDDAAGPYPLVVFSHGFSLNPEWYRTLLEHYASHGFVVLAPEHVEQQWGEVALASIERLRDIVRTLDHAERLTAPGGELADRIDMANVALVGHSFGGYTALAMAGARYDLNALQQRCAALAEDAPEAFLCLPYLGQESDMATRAGLDAVPEGLWPPFGDPRITAIVPIAGDAYLFGDAGLAPITVPMMAIGGTADTGTPWAWGSEPSFVHASSARKALVGFVGAEHMFVSTPCQDMPWIATSPFASYLCLDPVWDKDRALDLTHHVSTTFLLAELKGDGDAAAALAPDAMAFPGIEYRSAGYE